VALRTDEPGVLTYFAWRKHAVRGSHSTSPFQGASHPLATICRYITDAMQRLLTERERRFLRTYLGFDSEGRNSGLRTMGQGGIEGG
jgi:hypothetical protein